MLPPVICNSRAMRNSETKARFRTKTERDYGTAMKKRDTRRSHCVGCFSQADITGALQVFRPVRAFTQPCFGRHPEVIMSTPKIHARVDYVEYNVADIERAKEFYGEAFGWTFTDYSPDYCEFFDGRLRGGLTTHGPRIAGGPLIVLHADHLEAVQERVEKAGGTITRAIFPFPGGRRFQFTDMDGYELGVWSEG